MSGMTELVVGDPIRVGGRELVPLVRVTSRVRRRAFVGGDGVGGGGRGFVYMRPVAFLDRSEAGERSVNIPSATAHAHLWLLSAFVVVPLVAVLLIALSRRSDDGQSLHRTARP
jgi:uncharacterized spore protein YtfJ